MYVCNQLWIPPSSPFLINTILENSRWYIKTNRNPHKIISCRIIFVMKLFIHSLSEPLGLRFPFKRHDFIWFHLFNNYFNSIWFLFLQRKKPYSKIISGYKVLMLLFNCKVKKWLTVTSGVMNFCNDWCSNDVSYLHLVVVFFLMSWKRKNAQNIQFMNLDKDFLGLE